MIKRNRKPEHFGLSKKFFIFVKISTASSFKGAQLNRLASRDGQNGYQESQTGWLSIQKKNKEKIYHHFVVKTIK